MSEKQKLYINGEWITGEKHYKLYSPYNQKEISEVVVATTKQVNEAIKSAYDARKVMKSLSALKRSEILSKAADLFKKYRMDCANILVKENSKPITAALGEIDRTIETYQFAAEHAKQFSGEIVPLDAAKNGAKHFGFTKREPLGVIAAITPFNFPFNLTAHKLGPAIATGNTIVLKPASQTPLSGIMTAKIFEEAGLPKGALNVITGSGSEIGSVLVEDDRIKMITFTGSVPVGKLLREKSGLKKVTLELGSNSGVIVESVEDLAETVKRCVTGAFNFSGQVCISVQRIYINENLYESFLDEFVKEVSNLRVGNPEEEDTDISALINKSEAERLEQWIQEAQEQGAEVRYGGERDASILQPTVITGTHNNLSVSCKEAFGPVVILEPYHDLAEAIEKVNQSDYGLQAGIFTKDISDAFKAIDTLEVGGVIVNDIPSFRVDNMPYGGIKESGVGKEGIKYSMEEMTESKFAAFKL